MLSTFLALQQKGCEEQVKICPPSDQLDKAKALGQAKSSKQRSL